jgi:two-component system CheB/CheR fusion protein
VSDGRVLVHDNVIATHVFRIAQEAISSAVKHGNAQTIVIDLSAQRGDLHMSIADDGVGLGKTQGDGKGIGMQTMVYRARVVGGTVEIGPGERGGTVVNCTIPNACEIVEAMDANVADKDGVKTKLPRASRRRRIS